MQLAELGADAWQTALAQLDASVSDVYFTPRYHALHLGPGITAACTRVDDGAAALLIPTLRVALPEMRGRSDLQTCNGYGGPLASAGADARFLASAWQRWRDAEAERGTVAALFRLHPLVGNARWLPADAVVRRDRATVFVELGAGLAAAWQSADARHRNMVSKARRAGATPRWNQAADWPRFAALYHEAMERLAAPARLRFDADYFAALAGWDAAELVTLDDAHGLAGGAIFLWGGALGHYHLAARRADAANYVANALVQAGLERAAARGLGGVHLGGGVTSDDDDPLLRFKRSLGGRLLDFAVAQVVVDAPALRALCDEWTRRHGRAPTWLLGYRQPP